MITELQREARRRNIHIAKAAQLAKAQTRTHCRRGHELTPDNIVLDAGRRQCRSCQSRRQELARQKYASIDITAAYGLAAERFREGLPEDCWPWLGAVNVEGYGRINHLTKTFIAHRVVYLMRGGVIPDGLTIDHICRNKLCVNPAHMEPVTFGENARRARKVQDK